MTRCGSCTKLPVIMRRGCMLARHKISTTASIHRARRDIRQYASTTKSSIPYRPLSSILIANRGEIAMFVSLVDVNIAILLISEPRRVGKTASQYGIKTTTIYTDPDARSQHALCSPFAVNLGHSSAYLDGDKIITTAKEHGCVGIHPGYGFVCIRSEF